MVQSGKFCYDNEILDLADEDLEIPWRNHPRSHESYDPGNLSGLAPTTLVFPENNDSPTRTPITTANKLPQHVIDAMSDDRPAADNSDDSPLHMIRVQDAQSKSLLKKDLSSVIVKEERIETSKGYGLNVAIQGDRSKPAILTYHDMGLNHVAQFRNFFNSDDMIILLRHFCVYHVDAPGQEENSAVIEGSADSQHTEGGTTASLPMATLYDGKGSDTIGITGIGSGTADPGSGPVTESWGSYLGNFLGTWNPNVPYPTMDELGEMIGDVLKHYNIKFVGFGVGAGANILSRFSLSHPNQVEGLFLIEASSSAAGWIEWGYQKLNSFYLRKNSLTNFTNEYLIWHHFGKVDPEKNHDLILAFRDYFLHHINNQNLSLFIESYIKRTDLGIVRKTDSTGSTSKNFRCPVMIVVGAESPHLSESESMYANLEPSRSSWLKLSDCGGMVLDEKPDKVFEAFRLFLQGMGYIPYLSHSMTSSGRRHTSAYYSPLSCVSSELGNLQILQKRRSEPNVPSTPHNLLHKVALIVEGGGAGDEGEGDSVPDGIRFSGSALPQGSSDPLSRQSPNVRPSTLARFTPPIPQTHPVPLLRLQM